MNPFEYLFEYFETNHFTLIFLVVLAALSCLRFLPKPRFSSKGWFWAILVLGLALRLAWLGFSTYEPKTAWDADHMLESDTTNIHAVNATKGIFFHNAEGQPTSRRPIGYPLFLAVFYKLFGVHAEVAWTVNLALFALSLWLIYRMGKMVFGEKAGHLAAFCLAVYPVSIYSVKLITDEHLFLPLWYLGLWLLLREMQGRRVPWALLWYGLIFGYATMTRTHTIFMPLVVGLAYWLKRFSWKKIALSVLGVFLLMNLVNAPWTLRNYRVYGIYVPYAADASYHMYAAMNFSATPEGGSHIPVEGEPGYSRELIEAKEKGDIPRMYVLSNRLMGEWIRQNPGRFALLGTCRLLYFMRWDRQGVWPIWFLYSEGSYDPSRPLSQTARDLLEETAYAFYYVLFFSSVGGIVWTARKWKALPASSRAGVLVVAACILLWLAEHTIIFPDRKYRFPLEPLMMLLASPFWQLMVDTRFEWIRERFRGRKRTL